MIAAWKVNININLSLKKKASNQNSFSVKECKISCSGRRAYLHLLFPYCLIHKRNTTFTGPFLITCMPLKLSFSRFIPFIIVSSSFSTLDSTFLHLFNLFISLHHTLAPLHSVSIPLSRGQWRVSKCNRGNVISCFEMGKIKYRWEKFKVRLRRVRTQGLFCWRSPLLTEFNQLACFSCSTCEWAWLLLFKI